MSNTINKSDNVISVQQILDDNSLSIFQFRVIILGFLVVFYDGYAAAVMGFIGSSLAENLHITASELNPAMVASLIGLAIGSFSAGPIADKFGRKMILIFAVAVFGLFSILTSMMNSVAGISFMRLIVGIGLGAAMPISITLVSEYSPQRLRSLLVAIMFCGFTAGSAGVGFIASALMPIYGWQGALSAGGWVALITLIILWVLLPESSKYLAEKNKSPEKIRAYLSKIGNIPSNITHFIGEKSTVAATAQTAAPTKQSSISKLFYQDLRIGTVMLWVIFFMTMGYIAVFTNWLPMMFETLGYERKDAATLAALFQVGGTIGALIIGAIMDRSNPYKVLSTVLLGGTIFTAAVAFYSGSYAWLVGGIMLIGFTISGGMVGFNALAATFYPTVARATGVSWALGVGRFGSISGSLLGGYLLGQQLGFGSIMSVLIIPTAITAILIFYMGVRYYKGKK